MSENTAAASDLASQYAAQVTGDLERNVKEQERVGADIAALRERLGTLQQDHAVLVSMQQALGVTPAALRPASAPAAAGASVTVPAPRSEAAPARASRKGTRAARTVIAPLTPPRRRPAAKAARPATGKAPARRAHGAAKAAKAPAPTLVELVRAQVSEPGAPRSAADVAAGLERAHSGRSFKTTVVRNALENLVARGQARRSKEGGSVFYTASGTPEGDDRAGAVPSE